MSLWKWLFFRGGEQEKHFSNEKALPLFPYGYEDISALDFGAFPLVEDFAIQLRQAGMFGIHLDFFSERLGKLASFPWWDNVEKDLPRYTLKDIPIGDFEAPFDDLEQGWQIVIFEDENFVYILQGDAPLCKEFGIWFRVPREDYYSEWMRVIREFNPAA